MQLMLLLDQLCHVLGIILVITRLLIMVVFTLVEYFLGTYPLQKEKAYVRTQIWLV
jgi:hypothetical protein